MSVSLTARDAEILDALAHRVRVFSLEQIGRTWWGECQEPNQPAKARLKVLTNAGLVLSYSSLAHPELPLEDPVIRWEPGDATPDFGAGAYRVRCRWTQPFRTVTCFIATKRAATLVGGCGGRRSRTSEQTHDIHLSAVFLRYRSRSPHLVMSWKSEARILRGRTDRREKLPDAIIEHDDARMIIEFGGSYTKEKLTGFHEYCATEEVGYEVW